ncbi:MAG: terminase family protein [Caulobacter sp.]|nr:terminase family protein [Caulobacter sp.]
MTNPTTPRPSNESTWSSRNSSIDSLIGLDPERVRATVPPAELNTVLATWRHRANDDQLPPDNPWRTWLLLGGRGSGKTWVGAGWLVEQALRGGRYALLGPSLHDVQEVMIEGPSGLRAQSPKDLKFRYEKSRRRVVWNTGAEAHVFSAEDPDSLRGPQFHGAWADEFCAWRRPGEVLAMLRFGLRLGEDPRLVVTTTPRPIRALRQLRAEVSTVDTVLPTATNAHNLAPAFLDSLNAIYGGTRLAAQEFDGLIVDGEGALWRAEDLARCRGARPPAFDKVVVAVDPPASATGDACGIVVAGRLGDQAFVLADRTVSGQSPLGWARKAVTAAEDFGADAIVAEANQGGEMVRGLLAQAQAPCAVKLVHARYSKRVRAEPVAALYERGLVVHCGAFPALEEELMALGCDDGGPSPDRADALVWAMTELLLGRVVKRPRVRVL